MNDSPSLRIFVVENHPDTLKWMKLYLEQRGHTVFTARTFSEAVELFPASECKVLISDIGLPDGDGWELMEKLNPPKDVFAIAMSGFGMNSDGDRSRAAGFRHHLLKPFKASELNAVLKEVSKNGTEESVGIVQN
jgi:CheY-like chemotaxis protein